MNAVVTALCAVPNPQFNDSLLANGADGISDIEGKAARVAASECGQRASFNAFS